MTNLTISRLAALTCFLCSVVATLTAMQGQFWLWLISNLMMSFSALVYLINYQEARRRGEL